MLKHFDFTLLNRITVLLQFKYLFHIILSFILSVKVVDCVFLRFCLVFLFSLKNVHRSLIPIRREGSLELGKIRGDLCDIYVY